MNKVIAVLALAVSSAALPATPDPVAKGEIEQLIAHLGSSGCQFNRNGSWYNAARAVSHLERKYEYLLDRDLAPTAEAFIERAASKSSSSGKPYLVKCSGPTGSPERRLVSLRARNAQGNWSATRR